ncbi:DnaB family helicase [Escherichia coli]|nr:DnaB family helicase [Escherichia coli]SQP51773.1 DnaB family helicase [Escherichia coli]
MKSLMYSTQELESVVLAGLMNGGATPDAFDVIATTPEAAFSVGYYRSVFCEIKNKR